MQGRTQKSIAGGGARMALCKIHGTGAVKTFFWRPILKGLN